VLFRTFEPSGHIKTKERRNAITAQIAGWDWATSASGAFRSVPRIVQKHDSVRCPDCQDKKIEPGETLRVLECGCERQTVGQVLCAQHAREQGRCLICGEPLDAKDAQTPDEKKSSKERRRRKLKEAVREKNAVRDIETARRLRSRKERGKTPPLRPSPACRR